jgi:hypothetical protein
MPLRPGVVEDLKKVLAGIMARLLGLVLWD